MTSLNIGDVAPTKRPPLKPTTCPACGAGSDKREMVGSFGSNATRVLCGNCAHEFKE